ncbi:MAG: hypothetical protein A2Y75_11645 [Candidatus Solincola sediminis]|uniref:DUF1638 domain-containing protein n=1 Tax=Candidatus Solincola sediminis TaxID=1797199 RepID=A0A1F2WRL9_9ACTN|nr:MAG: hypothetical protein A2Y75_11645 [Candidatus Solincola sediminis]
MRPRKIIACATVVEELRRIGISGDELRELDFGLHVNPEQLGKTLQAEIDAIPPGFDIVLGYGLCSNAVVGLSSSSNRLIIPRIDDCIALFLGSKDEYQRRLSEEPGTYFLTKGWIEAADHPYREFLRMSERYGSEKAMRVVKLMLANYRRMVLINTGNYHLDACREAARTMAEVLGLRYEEIPGSNRMLKMMLDGDWSREFVVAEPGESIELSHFLLVC